MCSATSASGSALALSGIRYRVRRHESTLPLDRAAVYCSNHQSNVDPPVLFDALHPRMHILYKHEIDKIPILARAFRLGGFIPVDRRNKEAAMRSIEAGAQSIRVGQLVSDFPGRHAQPDRRAAAVQEGRLHHGDQGQAPIVPVAITGGRRRCGAAAVWLYPAEITIKVGRPIETAGLSLDERDELIDRVRAEIEELLRTFTTNRECTP